MLSRVGYANMPAVATDSMSLSLSKLKVVLSGRHEQLGDRRAIDEIDSEIQKGELCSLKQ